LNNFNICKTSEGQKTTTSNLVKCCDLNWVSKTWGHWKTFGISFEPLWKNRKGKTNLVPKPELTGVKDLPETRGFFQPIQTSLSPVSGTFYLDPKLKSGPKSLELEEV